MRFHRLRLYSLALHGLVWFLAVLPALGQGYYSNSELDTLVGPIALYPDPLLSNVVKASTYPDQVAAAAGTTTVDSGWDDSVKAVHSYPDVMTLMGSNPEWTQSLGWAASNQLSDLMDAVQRFRYRAQQAGNLQSGDQMTVIQEGTTIRIESANPEVIYVPTYNPSDVDDDNFGAGLFFGAAIATSAFLWTNMFHWNDCRYYVRPYGWYPPAAYYRPYGWQGAGVFQGNTVSIGNTNVVRGGVRINNVTFNNRARNGSVRVNTNNNVRIGSARGNTTRVNTGTVNVNARANTTKVNTAKVNTGATRVSRPNQGQNPRSGNSGFARDGRNTNLVRPEAPTRVGRPALPQSRPAASSRPNLPRNGALSAPRSSRPGIGSYSSAGQTVRQSSRGAQSRGTRSVSSGARASGGNRAGAGRAGGGRRR